MKTFIGILIFLHVFAGISSLISGICAMVLRKNTPKHRIAGKVYFYNMTFIFVSGLYLAIYRESLFFVFISFFVYHSLITGYRSLKLKNLHQGQKPEKIDWIIEGVAGVFNLFFIGYGIYWYSSGHGTDALIPMVFGLIGVRGVYQNIFRFINRPVDPTHWLQKHIGGMMGSYIGAATAFLVNQSSHIPIPDVILWLGPTAILAPFIAMEIRRIKAKTPIKLIN